MKVYHCSCYLLLFIPFVVVQRITEELYEPLEGAVLCFRRLNATHQTGCSSPDGGSVGIIQIVETLEDAEWIVNSKPRSYAPLISIINFTKDILEIFLGDPRNVAGILVYNNVTTRPLHQSDEAHCPNQYTSENNSCPAKGWNPVGTDLLQRDIPFPIFYLPRDPDPHLKSIFECYEKFGQHDRENLDGRALCSIHFHSFMFAAVDSRVCMRRQNGLPLRVPSKFCDPLGDENIIMPLYQNISKDNTSVPVYKENSTYLVTARLDSTSMFDGIAPGAASTVVGVVILQVLATALSKMLPKTQESDANIVFALFNGEAYDYIGSSRMAYDMTIGAYPYIDPKSIRLHLEIGQIGGALKNQRWPFTAFSPNVDDFEITDFVSTLNKVDKDLNVSTKFTEQFPPSSAHAFRRVLGPAAMRHLVLVDHDDAFTNQFYHGIFDDVNNIGFEYANVSVGENGAFKTTEEMLVERHLRPDSMQVRIAGVAKALAAVLYEKVKGEPYPGNDEASAHLVDELLYCWLVNNNCVIVQAIKDVVAEEKNDSVVPASLYVSVQHWITNLPTVYAARTLALLTSHKIVPDVGFQQCIDGVENGLTAMHLKGWNHSGVCVYSFVNTTEALSPAFLIPGYDMLSGMYSSWTESAWRTMWARLLVTGAGHGATIAGWTGAVTTTLAALAGYFANARKSTLLPAISGAVHTPIRVDC